MLPPSPYLSEKKCELDWEKQDLPMVSRRILVTKPEINGKTLGSMHFRSMYGVNVTRVNRSGMDLFADPNLILQVGDRVMVVGQQDAVERVAGVLGNQLKRLDTPNIVTIFVGIFLGILLGSLPIAFPGMPTPLKLGLAGGPLVVAILIGRFGHKLHLVTYTHNECQPDAARNRYCAIPCQCRYRCGCQLCANSCRRRRLTVCRLWFPDHCHPVAYHRCNCKTIL